MDAGKIPTQPGQISEGAFRAADEEVPVEPRPAASGEGGHGHYDKTVSAVEHSGQGGSEIRKHCLPVAQPGSTRIVNSVLLRTYYQTPSHDIPLAFMLITGQNLMSLPPDF